MATGHRSGGLFFALLLLIFFFAVASSAFQSDELPHDDEEFDLDGAPPIESVTTRQPLRRRADPDSGDSNSVQFAIEHALGDSDFSPAGTFTARLKSIHRGQGITKLRLTRNELTGAEKEAFQRLLKEDDFYTIRIPTNVLNPPGKDFVTSSIRARCLPRKTLDEHFVIHMDGVNVLAVNYGSAGGCQYPRALKLPEKWSFNSNTLLKTRDIAPRTPSFAETLVAAENMEGEGVKPPEKSFWAKYWMYLIPLGLIIVNAVTQAMNMPPDEQAGEQSAAQVQQAVAQRAATVRRR